MLDFFQSDDFLPGSWKVLFHGYKKVLTAYVTCPHCERTLSLKNNKIKKNGTTVLNVKCIYPDCDFSEKINLNGWDPEAWEPSE